MSEFKVGDKVQRNEGMRYEEDQKIGYTDAILTIEHIRTDGTLKFVEDSTTTHYCKAFYSLVVSNTEPDISKFGWVIFYQGRDEYKLVLKWLNDRGYFFRDGVSDREIKFEGFLSNVFQESEGIHKNILFHQGSVEHNGRKRHRIKFKFTKDIGSVEFPDITPTEREIKIAELRTERERINKLLKELENQA